MILSLQLLTNDTPAFGRDESFQPPVADSCGIDGNVLMVIDRSLTTCCGQACALNLPFSSSESSICLGDQRYTQLFVSATVTSSSSTCLRYCSIRLTSFT